MTGRYCALQVPMACQSVLFPLGMVAAGHIQNPVARRRRLECDVQVQGQRVARQDRRRERRQCALAVLDRGPAPFSTMLPANGPPASPASSTRSSVLLDAT